MATLQGSMHWSRLFTRMLNAEVKLVGPTITCSNPATVSVNDTMPYVQFNALATDKVSFHLLLKHVDTPAEIVLTKHAVSSVYAWQANSAPICSCKVIKKVPAANPSMQQCCSMVMRCLIAGWSGRHAQEWQCTGMPQCPLGR